MAIFSTSARMIKLYKKCDGRYVGFGPANAKPNRLRVRAFFPKRKQYPTNNNKMYIMLAVPR